MIGAFRKMLAENRGAPFSSPPIPVDMMNDRIDTGFQVAMTPYFFNF